MFCCFIDWSDQSFYPTKKNLADKLHKEHLTYDMESLLFIQANLNNN